MSKESSSPYPWAALYNLESQRGTRSPERPRRVGRPRNPIQRSQTSIHLTAEEKRLLVRLTALLEERFFPAKVSRSQVVGLGIHLLGARLLEQDVPEEVDDWPSLVLMMTEER
jgi:hypothetical protein